MAGRVRPLVPFFLPTSDGSLTVNDALSVANPSQTSAPLVQLAVRTWDVDHGVFKDAVHVVRDLPPPNFQKKSLLTPAEIKRKRARTPAVSVPNMPISQSDASPSAKSETTPQRRRADREDDQSTPNKPRPFAGSTFEAASPPPNGLPIPSFVQREMETPSEDVVDAVEIEPDDREKAALELRRMLRI